MSARTASQDQSEAMTDTFSYDLIPYSSFPFPQTTPENLAAIARLFGLESPDFRRARVLELACSSGGNIIPLAELYPEATFRGIDISRKELEPGIATIDALGLRNIRLDHLSVTDLKPDYGTFDYIIAHGLYSWVDEDVQEHILRICRENLSERGVAFVSYNTYPGWNLVNSVRDLMRFHTRQLDDPAKKTQQARLILKFMSEGLEGNNSAHAQLLRDEMKLLADKEDYYLYHDHLSSINRPQYFHEFMDKARAQHLEYLADTDLQTMLVDNLPAKVAEELRKLKDIVQSEQYMDFFRNRRFRHTLLVHQGQRLQRHITPAVLEQFHLAVDLQRQGDQAENLDEGVEQHYSKGAMSISTSSRLSKLVFKVLIALREKPIAIDELLARVRELAPEVDPEELRSHILQRMNLLQLMFSGLLKLRLSEGPYRTEVEERPCASRVVRRQAERGEIVTNGRHQSVKLQPVEAMVLRYLDGTRSIEQVVAALLEQEQQGRIQVHVQGGEGADKAALLESNLRGLLERFAGLALLV